MKKHSRKNYMAFLLRLWQEGEAKTWRATLENPHNGKRYGFADIEKLYAFLDEKTGNIDKKGDRK
jgi:hypothetical protein